MKLGQVIAGETKTVTHLCENYHIVVLTYIEVLTLVNIYSQGVNRMSESA